MLKFNDDYFTLETKDAPSSELYYWADVIRVAYYVHRDPQYYRSSSSDEVYLIIEHECGEYLRIPKGSADWDVFEQNIDKYLTVKQKERASLLKNPPLECLIDIYVRK
ncbi:MAG: hypothetical protein PHD21_02855 [Flavobacteriales bacterium]|nr:hypothetical protein [Flavobacteriales bacterium]